MKIFSCEQIREIDAYTIRNEPVASIDLMERAAAKLNAWLTERFKRPRHFIIFCGPGNNGGDGLALARLLADKGYTTEAFYINISDKTSADFELNRQRLQRQGKVILKNIDSVHDMPVIPSASIVIDAIFGSGLSRPAEGLAREIINHINQTDAVKVAVDIPSGLFCGNNGENDPDSIIKADITLSFQFPKLAFMFAENERYTGEWYVLPINLHHTIIRNTVTPYKLLENDDILPLLRRRSKFDHKGNFGHALLVAGSYGKMGAAILGASAALRTGTGLLTCHVPFCGFDIMQTAIPESMISTDPMERILSVAPDTDQYSAVAIGPGIGTERETQRLIDTFLSECRKPMVLDADALNILSLNRDWLPLIPSGTILTPHPKEFARMTGEKPDSHSRLLSQIEFSTKYHCIVILKGAHTSISCPDGNVYFNSTGNPGMAKGGSGDVLTGILLSLLAQGYTSVNASILGVYLHGLAGDIAAADSSPESIIATDIINSIGKAFNRIRDYQG